MPHASFRLVKLTRGIKTGPFPALIYPCSAHPDGTVKRAAGLDLGPVTPEIAGSSPVGPANLKLSCAATSRRFVFPQGRLENWRSQSHSQGRQFREQNSARTRDKTAKCFAFRRECSTEKRVTTPLKCERRALARPGRGCEGRRVSMARIGARVAAREGHARLRGGSASSCASSARDASSGDVRPFGRLRRRAERVTRPRHRPPSCHGRGTSTPTRTPIANTTPMKKPDERYAMRRAS